MRKLIAVASAAALVLVIAAPVGGTPATRSPFDGFIHFCSSGPEDVRVTPGGTVRIRGSNTNQWATGNPYINGIESNVVLVNFSPVSGIVRLNVTLVPDAFPGSSWEIVQTIHFRPDGSVPSQGVGHGTGALNGMSHFH
jgi:hypothetical protein